jgi:TolA-binding protein
MIEAAQGGRLRGWLVVGLLLGSFIAGGGCAYYNGFYNAKKAFSDAEDIGKDIDPRNQPTGAQKTKYATCIRKCENLLEEYPDSGLIDDALFLIGKSNYRMKNYRDAVRYMDNVLVNFPNSQFRQEALYLKSLAHLSLGEEQVALDQFRLLRENYPDGRFGIEALYRLGDAYRDEERYDEAVRYYEQYLKDYPKDKARDEVILALGNVYLELEDYEKAVEILEKVDRRHAARRVRFDADMAQVKALRELGRTEDASVLIPPLEKEAAYFKETASVRILEGQIQLDLGNEERGVEILDDVALSYPNTDHPGHARHLLATYFLKKYGPDDERAYQQLETALEGQSRGEYATPIRDLKTRLERYQALKKRVDRGDSTASEAAFRLGELLLIELDRPDEAATYYRKCLELAPDTELAPRAAYAVAYIESAHADPDSAQLAYDFLRERYPDSPQALSLDGVLFLDPKPKHIATGDETAAEEPPENGSGELAGANGRTGAGVRGDILRDPRRALRRGGPGASVPRSGFGR